MKLSIVVCAYNEENSIGPLLNNLRSQRLPPEIGNREIIVVASGCTDKTVNKVKESLDGEAEVRLIEEKTRKGKASAINKAFQISTGDYIVLVPADVEPADDALFNLLVPFREGEVSAVSGRPIQNPRRASGSLASRMAEVTYKLWEKFMKKLEHDNQIAHCSGELMAIRSSTRITIPSECTADDSYIAIAARRKGKIKFATNAVCYNLLPTNIVDYINQRRRWLHGHLQTKKTTGEYPTVMDTMALSKPSIAIQVLTEEIREQPRHVLHLVVAITIEAVIYPLSVIDQAFHRQHGVWPVIRSTKYVSLQ
jgi:cellulose synthase/poly-beta-1,6-N-acetylglucosamine synthase-like glycosyltransferase